VVAEGVDRVCRWMTTPAEPVSLTLTPAALPAAPEILQPTQPRDACRRREARVGLRLRQEKAMAAARRGSRQGYR
jgi:hypothetical protein